jgi:diaminobutyrate-2-oxoglutarate transaminase
MLDDTTFTRHESQVRTYCRTFPAIFTRAKGPYLWDTEGRRYVDLLCGAGALNYGHNEARIAAAVRDYLLSGGPVTSLDLFTTAKHQFIERFAEVILEPRGMNYVMQFPGPAGTLAVEAAIKLARKVTGRTNVVSFSGGFHGASLGALALSSSPLLRGAAGTPLRDATILPYDDGHPDAVRRLRECLLPAVEADPPAAFVVETVQGEGGLKAASPEWLIQLRTLAHDMGALLIVDDIQAGCGRTGDFFSFDGFDLRPDIICLSKSLSGIGLPMAMVLLRRHLDVWRPGEHNGTFRGNNMAFVAATAALEHWTTSAFRRRIAALRDEVHATLHELVSIHRGGGVTVTGRGLMSGLRFQHAAEADELRARLFEIGVIAETSGDGRVLKMFPPLTMSAAQWRETAEALFDAFVPRTRTVTAAAA